MLNMLNYWILIGIIVGIFEKTAALDTENKHSNKLTHISHEANEYNVNGNLQNSKKFKTIFRRSANNGHGPPFPLGNKPPFGNRFPKPWGLHHLADKLNHRLGNGFINFGNHRPPFGLGGYLNQHNNFNLHGHQTRKPPPTESPHSTTSVPDDKLSTGISIPLLEIPASLENLHDSYATWWSQFHGKLESCGQGRQPDIPPKSRVIGGLYGKIEEWPWMVSMYSELIQQPWCAGTLIADQWVLTAAHCFNGPFANPMSWSLHFGKVNSSGAAEYVREQVRAIDTVFIHPDYNELARAYAFNGDVALIKLDKPVEFTSTTAPICLVRATSDLEAEPLKCKITGYGISNLTDVQQGLNVLHVAGVPLVDKATCSSLEGYQDKVTNNMICAGRLDGGVDTCKGDSGGPLQCQFEERWHLTGVTSWGGRTYQECAEPNQPGVYTDVSKYTSWIYSHIYMDYVKMNL